MRRITFNSRFDDYGLFQRLCYKKFQCCCVKTQVNCQKYSERAFVRYLAYEQMSMTNQYTRL